MSTSSGVSSGMRRKSSPSGSRVASSASQRTRRDRFDDQLVAVFAHDGVIAGELELARNPDGLVSAILE